MGKGKFLKRNLQSTDLLEVHSLGLPTGGIVAHRGAAVHTGSGLQGASRHLCWADGKKGSDMLYRWFSLIFLQWSSKEIVHIKRRYGEDLNMLEKESLSSSFLEENKFLGHPSLVIKWYNRTSVALVLVLSVEQSNMSLYLLYNSLSSR